MISFFVRKKWTVESADPQSRESGKIFFSSGRNWDSPTPSAAGECAPPPSTFWPGGRGTPACNGGTYTVVLCMCMYYVKWIIESADPTWLPAGRRFCGMPPLTTWETVPAEIKPDVWIKFK
jgi:hypothetical protein